MTKRGSVAGTILPFSFNQELDLIVDPALLEHDELYFNTARLDRSLALSTSDYVALARPRIEGIAASRGSSPDVPAVSQERISCTDRKSVV